MIVPRRGHDCVSITTSRGEKLMAVGGLDKRNKPVKEVELFDPKTKTWTVDERRSLRYPTKKYEFYSLLSSFSGSNSTFSKVYNCYNWLQSLFDYKE